MISKPLFKQSIKANAFLWSFVTFTTCAMLAIVIVMLSSISINEMKDSMMSMFITSEVESTVKQQSMNYYNMTDNALKNYIQGEESLKDLLQIHLSDSEKEMLVAGYNNFITNGYSDSEAREQLTQSLPEEQVLAINTLLDYYLIQREDYSDAKISEYMTIQISNGIYNAVNKVSGNDAAISAKQFIEVAIQYYIAGASLNTSDFANTYIPEVLKGIIYNTSFDYNNEQINISDYFTEDKIHDISYNSIMSFRVNLTIKENQIREALSQEENYSSLTPIEIEIIVSERLLEYVDTIITNLSVGLMDSLPEEAVNSLTEMADMDIYELVVGSIFFKVAGILLPLIYAIVVANNLIAGQVDAGSMAFVLSTPIKRKRVALTQITFLVSSLLLMFILTTIVSIASLALVNSAAISLSYTQLLLLNLGVFLTMFAISGICFLASSWFNRTKHAMGVGGGLSIFFLVATILGIVGGTSLPSALRIEAMNIFNYISIITLFDTSSILNNTTSYLWKFGILVLIGIVTFGISIIKFNKKDLPL